MNEDGQARAIESLRDWSKWLIGLNFGAVAGCVLILEKSPATFSITPFLVLAIVFFGLSIGCSMLLQRRLAYITEVLPLLDAEGKLTTLFTYRAELGLTIGQLASAQLVLLVIAAFFFMVWVIIRALLG